LALLRAFARRLFFQGQAGVLERPAAPGRLLRVEHPQSGLTQPPPPVASPRAGLLTSANPDGASAAAQAMRQLGIDAERATAPQAAPMLRRARHEAWPLVALELAAIAEAPKLTALLGSYVHAGGCLLVTGVETALERPLRELCAGLEIKAPALVERHAIGDDAVVFPADQAGFSLELAGTALEGVATGAGMHTTGGAVLARWVGEQPATAVWEACAGSGSLILSVGESRLAASPHFSVEARHGITFLTPLMALRRAYGEAVWRPPFPLANFTVDDPLLRVGLIGLSYPHLLEQSQMHGYHVSVAIVPDELELAQAEVIELLLSRSDRLSACYQFADHAGHTLRQGVENASAFATRTGLALDRVAVFPDGVGQTEAPLPELGQLGLLAACPSPLLWRRSLRDRNLGLDLFVGRPALAFAHRRDFDAVLADMSGQASRLNGMARVNWCGLEQVARHSYLQRRQADGSWQVGMTGSEICLHNADATPRRYRVTRPQLPPGALLAACGRKRGTRELELAVRPGETVVVSVVMAGQAGPAAPVATTRPCRLC
jgi:hypothetical protein